MASEVLYKQVDGNDEERTLKASFIVRRLGLVFLLFSLNANAGENSEENFTATYLAKGARAVGGSFNISTSGSFQFSVTPSMSYFVSDHLSLDGLGVIGYSEVVYGATGGGASYYYPLGDRLAPFVSQSFTANIGSDINTTGSSGLGAVCFIAPRVALRGTAQISYAMDPTPKSVRFSVLGGFVIYLN